MKNIPSNRFKEISNVCAPCLTRTWNNEIDKNYPDKLELADVTTVLDKKYRNVVKSYRTVVVLRIISKIFERKLKKANSVLY